MIRSIVLAALIAAASPLGAAPANVGEVVAAERAFAAMAKARGINAAFRHFSADDAIAFQPDPVPARPGLDGPDGPGTLDWWPIHAGISVSGDLGFTTGPFRFEAGDHHTHGYYFTIWRRQRDGQWRWVLDHGPPMSEAPPYGPNTPVTALAAAPPPPPGTTQGSAWAELLTAEAALARGLAADAPAAYSAFLADQARVMRVGPQPAVGREAFDALLKSGPARIAARHLGGGVSRAGDLAYSYGRAGWERNGSEVKAYYVRIWQRRGAAGWKLVMDEIIPVPPPRPAPAGGH
jgi:ketosteroid isomerase-like protein